MNSYVEGVGDMFGANMSKTPETYVIQEPLNEKKAKEILDKMTYFDPKQSAAYDNSLYTIDIDIENHDDVDEVKLKENSLAFRQEFKYTKKQK